MPDEVRKEEPYPAADVRTGRRRRWTLSLVWLVPLAAVATGAWLAWGALSRLGPTITVSFQSAEGLQTGQSQLKFKDIVLGTVRGLSLSPDRRRVLVRVETTKTAAPLLTEGADFWVVKPRLFAGNLSGLDTLLSGAYLQLRPAAKPGPPKTDFVGLEDPPVLESAAEGRTFLLKANRIGSITLGSPIFYRGMTVGEVLGWDIGDMAQTVTVHAFVREPFDKYVHDNSRFWNASGLNVRLGSDGINVQLESLRAVLLGGVAFDTPEIKPPKGESADNHPFPLYPTREIAEAASYEARTEFVSYFPGSVRGLAAGADVTLHGLKIGTVKDVTLTYDRERDAIVAPVMFEVQVGRFLRNAEELRDTPEEGVQNLVNQGMRATLQSSNLLTGQMLVALDFFPDAKPVKVQKEGDALVLPTMESGGFAGIESGAAMLLAKLNSVPFDEIGRNLDQTVKGLSDVANGPQLKQTLAALSSTMLSVQDTVRKLDSGMTPVLKRLPDIADNLQKTTAQANKLVTSLDNGYGDNTRFSRDLERLLVQANEAASSVRALSDLLTRHPEALIRGRTNQGVE
jgi:paraquat-inducible protein B